MVYRATVGSFEIISLQVWPLQQVPAGELLGESEPRDLASLRDHQPRFYGEDAGLLELTQNIFVIKTPKQTILVDTGEPLNRAGSILEWGLASVGIKPADIDVVFLTHRDSDHVGGTVNLQGQPQYPNARYLMAETEYQDFRTDPKRNALFQKCMVPLEAAGQLELLAANHEITSGIHTLLTPGHRSGATSLYLSDGGQAALILADTLHFPAQATHPEWSSEWDGDKTLAAQTRMRVMNQAEQEGLTLAAPHIPFGGLGMISTENQLRIWKSLH